MGEDIIIALDADVTHAVLLEIFVGIVPDELGRSEECEDEKAEGDKDGNIEAEGVSNELGNDGITGDESIQDIGGKLGDADGSIVLGEIGRAQDLEGVA